MVNHNSSIRRAKQLAAGAIMAVLLSACSLTEPPADTWQSTGNVDFLTPSSSADVRFAQAGEVIAINSQGRQQFEAKVTQRYFAASGRHCVSLQAVDKRWVACEYPSNEEQARWGLTQSFRETANGTL